MPHGQRFPGEHRLVEFGRVVTGHAPVDGDDLPGPDDEQVTDGDVGQGHRTHVGAGAAPGGAGRVLQQGAQIA